MKELVPLSFLRVGESGLIVSVTGHPILVAKLKSLGFDIGKMVLVVATTTGYLGSYMLVKVEGRQVKLNYSEANYIIVEREKIEPPIPVPNPTLSVNAFGTP
jgi:Fe2+ transport system protein FeoA